MKREEIEKIYNKIITDFQCAELGTKSFVTIKKEAVDQLCEIVEREKKQLEEDICKGTDRLLIKCEDKHRQQLEGLIEWAKYNSDEDDLVDLSKLVILINQLIKENNGK